MKSINNEQKEELLQKPKIIEPQKTEITNYTTDQSSLKTSQKSYPQILKKFKTLFHELLYKDILK